MTARRRFSRVASSSGSRWGARSLAIPDVLLLDEPFSNLDARRRDEMRFELKEVQARVGVTTIFVTHDQNEAMILSDRVVVMNAGRIAQEGTPQAIYQRPSTRFVMEFLGQVDQVSARVALAPDGSPRRRGGRRRRHRGSARRIAPLAARTTTWS